MLRAAALLALLSGVATAQVTQVRPTPAPTTAAPIVFACLDVEFTDGTREIGPCVAAGSMTDYERVSRAMIQNDVRKKMVKTRKTFPLTK